MRNSNTHPSVNRNTYTGTNTLKLKHVKMNANTPLKGTSSSLEDAPVSVQSLCSSIEFHFACNVPILRRTTRATYFITVLPASAAEQQQCKPNADSDTRNNSDNSNRRWETEHDTSIGLPWFSGHSDFKVSMDA